MKKILLATTALAAVSVVSVAQAQESQMMSAAGNDLSIGGFYEFGWASNSDDVDIDGEDRSKTYGDSELYIDFENTSDNGLTYGVQIDLEISDFNQHAADQDDVDTPDEASLYLRGNFGTFHLGHTDDAFSRHFTWAPTHDGAASQYDSPYGTIRLADGVNVLAPASTTSGIGRSTNAFADDAKITYVTPSIAGFQFALSGQDDDGSADASAFGGSYTTELGGSSVRLAGGSFNNGGDDDDETSERVFGVSVGVGDFTITASNYAASKKGGEVDTITGEIEAGATELGVGYKVSDAFSVGLSRSSGTAEIKDAGATLEDENTTTAVSASYAIAPGLKTTLAYNIFSNKRSVQGGTTGNTATTGTNDGNEIVWQIEFAF